MEGGNSSVRRASPDSPTLIIASELRRLPPIQPSIPETFPLRATSDLSVLSPRGRGSAQWPNLHARPAEHIAPIRRLLEVMTRFTNGLAHTLQPRRSSSLSLPVPVEDYPSPIGQRRAGVVVQVLRGNSLGRGPLVRGKPRVAQLLVAIINRSRFTLPQPSQTRSSLMLAEFLCDAIKAVLRLIVSLQEFALLKG